MSRVLLHEVLLSRTSVFVVFEVEVLDDKDVVLDNEVYLKS